MAALGRGLSNEIVSSNFGRKLVGIASYIGQFEILLG